MPLCNYTNKVKFEMQIVVRLLFVLVAIAVIVAVFYVSWFWRALIIPMVVILLWDVVRSSLKKREKD